MQTKTQRQEIPLDIKAALIEQDKASAADKAFRHDLLTVLKYEDNTSHVAEVLGVNRRRVYEWLDYKWLPRDAITAPVIREIVRQWADGIRKLLAQSPSQS